MDTDISSITSLRGQFQSPLKDLKQDILPETELTMLKVHAVCPAQAGQEAGRTSVSPAVLGLVFSNSVVGGPKY